LNMGRTKNSKNKAGHGAGGDRRSDQFREKQADEKERKNQVEESRKANAAARREREREQAAKREKECEERRNKRIKETRQSLSKMSGEDLEHLYRRHQSYKNANDGDSDDDEDDDYDDDDDLDEEEDYETEDEGEGEVKQRRLHQRAAYKPAEGTAIHNDLKQFENKIHGNKNSGQRLIINNVRNDVMNGKLLCSTLPKTSKRVRRLEKRRM